MIDLIKEAFRADDPKTKELIPKSLDWPLMHGWGIGQTRKINNNNKLKYNIGDILNFNLDGIWKIKAEIIEIKAEIIEIKIIKVD